MPGPNQKVSFLLSGGIDEQAATELAAPIAQQGASLTLRASRNTRLSGERGTCVRAPAATKTLTGTVPLHGVVSCVAGRNAVAFSRVGLAPSKVLAKSGAASGSGAGNLFSPLATSASQNAYIPTQIERAGAIPSVASTVSPAVAVDTVRGWYWHAYTGLADDGSADSVLYVTVSDSEGSVIAPPVRIVTLPLFSSITNKWVAMTYHGSYGAVVWVQYQTSIGWYKLSISGNVVSIATSGSIALAANTSTCDVVSGLWADEFGAQDTTYGQYAYIACSSTASANNGAVIQFDLATNSVWSASNFIGALAGSGTAAVCFAKIGASFYVGCAFRDSANNITAQVLSATLGSSTGPSTATGGGDVAVQFLSTPVAGSALIVVASEWRNSFSAVTMTANGSTVFSRPLNSATLTQRGLIPWSVLRSHGTVLVTSATELYPVFDLVRNYGTNSADPTKPDYVLDPSIEMWLFGSLTDYSPVARYGTVRFVVAAARVAHATALPSGALVSAEGSVYGTYLKDILGSSAQTDYPARFVSVNFDPHQPPVVHDKDGVAMVAAALPVQWDGSEVVEVGGPLHAPKLRVDTSGGTGPVYPAGSYLVAAHYSWTDAGGLEHRSAVVSTSFTAPGATSPKFSAPIPDSMRRGVTSVPVDLVVYVSTTNGATLHRLPERPYNFAGIVFLMSAVSLADVTRQLVFSRGATNEEQMPQPPPPAQDKAIVGDRLWIIDGEVRSRLVYSKRRIAGKGFEFHPAYEVILPSGAGDAYAVREWQGTVVVFTKYAIFQIAGDGPDNLVGNPSGGSFSKPVKVAAVGCANRESVLTTPKGILFQRDNDVMLFSGGEPQALVGVQPAVITGAFLLPDADEAVLLCPSEQLVWNYSVNRWTSWVLTTGVTNRVHSLAYDLNSALLTGGVAVAGKGVLATPVDVYVLRSSVESATAEMSWTTDWLVLSGDFQDHVILRRVLFSARQLSSHGCTLEVFTNYDETTPTTFIAWTAAGLAGKDRYTIQAHPREQNTRAVKIRVTETEVGSNRSGMRPVCVTLVWAVENMIHEASLLQGASKG